MTESQLRTEQFSLDYAGRVKLQIRTDTVGKRADIELSSPTGVVADALKEMLSIHLNGKEVPRREFGSIALENGTDKLDIYFKNRHFLRLSRNSAAPLTSEQYGPEGPLWSANRNQRKLTATETRLIGRDGPYGAYPKEAPASQELQPPITDLHTHMSAQLSGDQILTIANNHNRLEPDIKKHTPYRCDLLDELGIPYPKSAISQRPRVYFFPKIHIQRKLPSQEDVVPLSLIGVSDEDLDGKGWPLDTPAVHAKQETAKTTLATAMDLSVENQNTFGDLENCYERREAFTKNIDLAADMVMQAAMDYANKKVSYAELSTNAIVDSVSFSKAELTPDRLKRFKNALKRQYGDAYQEKIDEVRNDATGTKKLTLNWLSVLEEAAEQAEIETGVRIRYLAGMPRNLNDKDLHKRLEKIVHVAKESHYVCGVDWLGYESNKTAHIKGHIGEMAKWIGRNRPDWVQRIHAGENSKNQRNVRECLELVEAFPECTFRIGHATHGIDKDTIDYAKELLKKGLNYTLEVLIDSNIANNTIDHPHESSLVQLIDNDLPTVISSDGPGIYGTDAYQSMLAALTANGMDFGMLVKVRNTENAHIERRLGNVHGVIGGQEGEFLQTQKERRANGQELEAYSPEYAMGMEEEAEPAPLAPEIPPTTLPKDARQPILVIGSHGTAWDTFTPEQERAAVIQQLRTLIIDGRMDPRKHFIVIGRMKQSGLGHEVAKIVDEYNQIMARVAGADTPKLECYMMQTEKQYGELPAGITGYCHMEAPQVSVPNEIISALKEQQVPGEPDPIVLAAGGHAFTRDMILAGVKEGWKMGLMNMVGASRQKLGVYPQYSVLDSAAMERFAQAAGIATQARPGWGQLANEQGQNYIRGKG